MTTAFTAVQTGVLDAAVHWGLLHTGVLSTVGLTAEESLRLRSAVMKGREISPEMAVQAFNVTVAAESGIQYDAADIGGVLWVLFQTATPEGLKISAQRFRNHFSFRKRHEERVAACETMRAGEIFKIPKLEDSVFCKTTTLQRARSFPVSEEIVLSYPFGERGMEWLGTDQMPGGRLAILNLIDTERRYLPEGGIGKRLDEERCHVFHGADPWVLKFYNVTLHAERLIVIQGILDAVGIPHIPMATDALALDLARLGVVVQERMPDGSRSLESICNSGLHLEGSRKRVEYLLGPKAAKEYIQFSGRLREVATNPLLQGEGFERGYTVKRPGTMWSPDTIQNSTLLDTHGGGDWGENIFYHSVKGWFLLDW